MGQLTLSNAHCVLDAGKAHVRSRKRAPAEALALARRLTTYEDWLEYEHPRMTALRQSLAVVRRRLEGGAS